MAGAGKRIGALGLLGAVGGAAWWLRARSGTGEPGADTVASSSPSSTAAVEDSSRGRSTDVTEETAPISPPSASGSGGEERLATASHEPPEGAVVPDDNAGDPLVEEQTRAAAAQAGAIGGRPEPAGEDSTGFPDDAAMRPVAEGSGDADETLEARDRSVPGHRQTEN